MGTLGWVLFALAVVWCIAQLNYHSKLLLHFENYIVYLLLSESIYTDHQEKFRQWIKECPATDSQDLGLRAHGTIARMSEALASESTLAATAMIARFKAQSK